MSNCNDRIPVWRVLILFITCFSIYLYLYTNAFDGMRTSSVFRVVEGDLQAVWKDKFGSISYYLKLMEQPDSGLEIKMSSQSSAITSTNPANTHQAASTVASKTSTNTQTKATEDTTDDLNVIVETLKNRILKNNSEPLLTLFTSWSNSAEKDLVHNLTVSNWLSLRPFITPVIFTNETEVAEETRKMGWEVFPIKVAAAGDIPVLKYMYKDVMEEFNSTFYAYCNGDILFTQTLVGTLASFLNSSSIDLTKPTMIVGKRTNVDNVTEEEGATWANITKIANSRGKLFTGYAEDFFITSRAYPWNDIAEVVIGRRAYDNWLVFNARRQKHTVIDATKTLLAVHQTTKAGNFEGHSHKNRDYNHNLLVKMYKRIKYGAGIVECIERYTDYKNKSTQLKSRNLPRHCAV